MRRVRTGGGVGGVRAGGVRAGGVRAGGARLGVRSNDAAAGPGHCFVVTDAAGQDWMLYHAWNPDAVGSTDPGRQLWLDRLDWTGNRPVVRGPTGTPQPAPAP